MNSVNVTIMCEQDNVIMNQFALRRSVQSPSESSESRTICMSILSVYGRQKMQ